MSAPEAITRNMRATLLRILETAQHLQEGCHRWLSEQSAVVVSNKSKLREEVDGEAERRADAAAEAIRKAQSVSDNLVATAQRQAQQDRAAAEAAYVDARDRVVQLLNRHREAERSGSLAWEDERWEDYASPIRVDVPRVVRIGSLRVPDIAPPLELPAVVPFVGSGNVLIEGQGAALDEAHACMRSLMLRMLLAIPPGRVEMTLIDPVGLGANMATFMQLPDVTTGARIWTEPAQIEQQLLDLTGHMETVIQSFLRNRYDSIEEYNQKAGMVAEAYRLLVVANFPSRFSDAAAQRLASIAANGPRTGVYVICVVDAAQKLPYQFDLEPLRRASSVIRHTKEGWTLAQPPFDRCVLSLDALPAAEVVDRRLEALSDAIAAGSAVELPFSEIAPAHDTWWTGHNDHDLRVPIGRMGADESQELLFGPATQQHALVVGKTGSGKSTLLHVLVLSAALKYSPDELELYLIDFKQGVEFKDYAALGLPHARVVAIQSEREFGVSVLQGLEAELQRRGDAFRAARVTNLATYRQQHPETRLPRLLLLIDEFQVLFTEGDRLSMDSARILDTLVKQGRAYGIHVILATQALAGAYSLGRSTIDQMAVRIALQCSEADSRLVLGDDNPAARLLSRPGEAIYNAQNGLIEGNDLFQTVWLSENDRKRQLTELTAFAERRGWKRTGTLHVFEGNAPGTLIQCEGLRGALAGEPPPAPAWELQCWLGEPVAIKPPTRALLRVQSCANLLLIGQNDEFTIGMLYATICSLAGQLAPDRLRFVLADFTNPNSRRSGALESLLAALPYGTTVVTRRDVSGVIGQLKDLITQRQGLSDGATKERVVFVALGLHRARALHLDDGAFFGGEDEGAAAQLASVLRDGPDAGVHSLLAFDTLQAFERVFERRALREFDYRIAMQMSSEDSSAYLDTPRASTLGPWFALLYDEETAGFLEKFRPYAVPDDEGARRLIGALS